jgi:hypothetical protein
MYYIYFMCTIIIENFVAIPVPRAGHIIECSPEKGATIQDDYGTWELLIDRLKLNKQFEFLRRGVDILCFVFYIFNISEGNLCDRLYSP